MRPQLTALLLLFAQPSALVQAQLRQEAGTAADLALAGATQTLSGESAAIFSNPASLGGLGFRLLFGLGLASANVRYTDDTSQSRDLAKPQPLGYAAATLPLWRGRIVAALAYSRRVPVFSRHAPAPDESNASALRFLGRAASWDEHEISVALATSFRWLELGVSFSAASVTVAFERTLFAGTAADLPSSNTRYYDVDLVTELAGMALAGKVGVALQPWWWMRAALTFETPRRLRLDGDATFSDPTLHPSDVVNLELQGEGAAANLDGPWRLGGGLALQLTRTLRLFCEVDLLLGGNRHLLELDQARWRADGREVPIQTLDLLPAPSTATSWRLALQLSLWGDHLRLRGGWAYSEGSYGTPGLGALLLDVQRHELGVGLVLRAKRIQLSLGIKHSFASELRLSAEDRQVVAPLVGTEPLTLPAGSMDLSRTQLALEAEVLL